MRTISDRLAGEQAESMDAVSGSPFPVQLSGRGYLLHRTTGPHGHSGPEAFTAGGNRSAEDDAAQVLAEHLTEAWQRVVDRDYAVVERLRGVERHYEVQVLPAGFTLEEPAAAAAHLVSGARVCFTGEVVPPAHGFFDRDDMRRLAEERGLTI